MIFKEAIKMKEKGYIIIIKPNWALADDLLHVEEIKGKYGRAITLEEFHSDAWKINEKYETLSDKIYITKATCNNCGKEELLMKEHMFSDDVRERFKTIKQKITKLSTDKQDYNIKVYNVIKIINDEIGEQLQ